MIAVELAVQDAAGARIARSLGADRVELCSALSLGGLTPSAALIEQVVACGPDVHVLIRPRAGGFVYSRAEEDVIAADIRHAVNAGAAGVVIGSLDESGLPDLNQVGRFVEAAQGVEVTFHRAIDLANDILGAAAALRGSGVARILTSGGRPSAYEGRETLVELVGVCGKEIQVQAGAGINPGNVRAVADTGVAAVHFSAKRPVAHPEGAPLDFTGHDATDADIAKATIAALRGE